MYQLTLVNSMQGLNPSFSVLHSFPLSLFILFCCPLYYSFFHLALFLPFSSFFLSSFLIVLRFLSFSFHVFGNWNKTTHLIFNCILDKLSNVQKSLKLEKQKILKMGFIIIMYLLSPFNSVWLTNVSMNLLLMISLQIKYYMVILKAKF